MTQAVATQQTYISFLDTGSPASPTGELAEVKAIPIGETSEELDATHLRSPGSYREYLQSFKDGNDVPLVLNFIPGDTSQQSLRTRWDTGSVDGYRVTFPDGSYCEFLAYVSAMGVPVTVGAVLELNASLRITGPTTWTFV